MKLGIRAVLAIAFFVASLIPLAVWAVWVSSSALEKEIHEVNDRHLVIAQNLSGALERYAEDVSAVFSHVVETDSGLRSSDHLGNLLSSLGFRHICLIDIDTRRVYSVTTSSTVDLQQISLPPLDTYFAMAEHALGELVFTDGTLSPSGHPVIYLVKKVQPNLVALGELSTDYIRKTQQEVTFGVGGHAAIVDKAGNVLAHPNETWVSTMKNIAPVDPVARMMKGETGVSKFFSPAVQADMIAGFTTIPTTGWGIMVPQPFEELEARADEVKQSAIAIVVLGVLISCILGWFIGGYIAKPVKAVAAAADDLAAQGSDIAVAQPRGFIPVEVRALTNRFNEMSAAVEQSRKAQRIALQVALEAAEAKSEFVTKVTHELRTPLNTVIGFSGLIRDQTQGPITQPEYVEYATMIHDSGQRLLEMVNDIITYARVEGRGEVLTESAVDVWGLVASAIDHIAPLAKERQINVASEPVGALPRLWADEIKLRQALDHILSNAVRFTPQEGDVIVDAKLEENGELSITVIDTGIGISEENTPKALAPFGQISSQFSRDYEGAGLGLPLAKLLLELHGGRLKIRSILGEGTSVTLTFPQDRVGQRGT